MKVTGSMTNESGNLIDADFLGLDGVGWKLERDEDLGVMTLDSTAYPSETGRFTARDLFGIAAQCIAVAGQIVAAYGTGDPYSDEIRKVYTREDAEGK